MIRISNRLFVILFLLLSLTASVTAQKPIQHSSSEILLKLKKLDVLGSALYVAAHPDDENTGMISYLVNGRLVNSAYLSMTRGDGGQNLIGPETREQLGIIRTQELLAARRIDGGQQFFTRAKDFGYSKNPEETQKIWDREEVLKDVVWTYRKFRPDVVITRFPPDGGGGHGHHTTSAILAQEAFKISGDPSVFTEQLQYVEPWKPTRIFINTGRWWNNDISAEEDSVIAVDIGGYSPLLGSSYTEISAVSRSQHKSQGFGVIGSRGRSEEFLEHQLGSLTEGDLFEGIDISWGRVKGGDRISERIDEIVDKFDFNQPHLIIDDLIELREMITAVENPFWKERKKKEVEELIKACAGLYIEIAASQYSAVPGESVELNIEVTNRSKYPLKLKSINMKNAGLMKKYDIILPENVEQNMQEKMNVPGSHPFSNPYWLNKEGSLGMYRVDNIKQIGKPENDPAFEAEVVVQFSGTDISYKAPVIYKWRDRVNGEQYRPFIIQPRIMLSIKNKVVIFPSGKSKEVQVEISSGIDSVGGNVYLDLPDGWESEPRQYPVQFDKKDQLKSVTFSVLPPDNQQDVEVVAKFDTGARIYDMSRVTIDYDHFPAQTIFPKATSKFVRINIAREGNLIGYIMGAGDELPESLEQIGYEVVLVNENDITAERLETFDAVIMGVRAVNTNENLKHYSPVLLDYVANGGTLIYQYNTSRGLIGWENFAPYELGFTGRSSDSRVSVEEAPVRILKPDHPVLQMPNKITSADFEGWIQERGLYFPNSWADNYSAILSSNDPGEEPKDGGLLIAKYGKGYYVYTGYAWFRQLPAGVPGAYRLFANIISLGNGDPADKSNLDIKE